MSHTCKKLVGYVLLGLLPFTAAFADEDEDYVRAHPPRLVAPDVIIRDLALKIPTPLPGKSAPHFQVKPVYASLDFPSGSSAITQLYSYAKKQFGYIRNALCHEGCGVITKNDIYIELSGHADNRGSCAANLRLSKQRVIAIKSALVSQGVPDDHVVVRYYGESKPIAPNSTPEGRLANRRVELRRIQSSEAVEQSAGSSCTENMYM